ncbi:hypothetical protein BX600DRAFT_535341 [Xylariales sp. PMI_506]|nr:hypothetical protein BX600DRAFT_535341 [Xylariales sp. PMI_506]
MCFYKRIIYDRCNHGLWSGSLARTCNQQDSFFSGDQTVDPCTEASSHPYKTLRLPGACPPCRRREAKTAHRMRRARHLISNSKRTLMGVDEQKCKDILEATAGDVVSAGSDENGSKSRIGDQGEKEGEEKKKAAGEKKLEVRPRPCGDDGADIVCHDLVMLEFLANRKADPKAHLYM